ncbi:MAG TPA: AAA family ATPase [Pseudoflavonifractor sp.]|nr:AAA family ATPase [Pseudoflavonifractor sp.]
MDALLASKLEELESAEKYECWYLVKQSTEFDRLCYLVSALGEYQAERRAQKLEDFIQDYASELGEQKSGVDFITNYRALRVAAFFGLIAMKSSSYNDAVLTETYEEIFARCAGAFEKTELYADVIQRQIEKIYLSSPIDEESAGIRKDYRLYPVMLLYKILLELGRATGNYSITMTEYRYLVATTRRFEDYLNTLLLISLLRKDPGANGSFEQYRGKFDNRFLLALKQLDTLSVSGDEIKLNVGAIETVARKVHAFEAHPDAFLPEQYIEFLGSTRALFDPAPPETAAETERPRENPRFHTGYSSKFPRNRILFGAPGTGKSFFLNREKDELLGAGGAYERVTFHPDYSYAHFVGTYKPVPCVDSDGKDAITYQYVPGPFLRTYVKALENSKTDAPRPYLLLIEEINRANVAAVFGDVFQLLDRDDNHVSEYPIHASEDVKTFLADALHGAPEDFAELRLPDNMFLWATMNSADQGVFPMDTAFKRRWDFRYLGIDESEAGIIGKTVALGTGTYRRSVEWNGLRKAINDRLSFGRINEDKMLGPYFLKIVCSGTDDTIDPEVFIPAFKSKVIMYLFEDAAKSKRQLLFSDYSDVTRYSSICRAFDEKGVHIFCRDIVDSLPLSDGPAPTEAGAE